MSRQEQPSIGDRLASAIRAHQQGQVDQAIEACEELLRHSPDHVDALHFLANARHQSGDHPAALALLNRVVELAPEHAAAWESLGNTLISMDRIDDALEAHRRALRLAPMSSRGFHYLVAVLCSKGLLDEAQNACRLWQANFPEDPRARHMLAACTGEASPTRASNDYVRAEFDSFAASFDTNVAKLEYQAPALLAGEVTRLLSPHAILAATLDAGCGTGLCGPFLRSRSMQLVGVDLSKAMVEIADKRGLYDELVIDELTAYLRNHGAAFDLIVAADTLIYFGDLGEVLPAAARALVPGGILAFAVESLSADDAPAGFSIRPSGRYGQTRGYLQATMDAAGFRDVAIREVDLRKEAGHWVAGFLVSGQVAR